MERIRKTRKNHIDYYLASSIIYKENGQGIYGFRLYDLQYGDYEIFTLKGVQAILKKYSDAILNIKVKNGYLGFCYIGSNNYSICNKHGEIIKNGNKIFVKREGINKYLIIDEVGKVLETDIRGIKNWVSHDVLLVEDKDHIARELKRDIEFFNKEFDKFSRREELLVITGNNYLNTKVQALVNGERIIKVYAIKDNADIPEGIVHIPREISIMDLELASLDNISIIDLRQAQNLRSLYLRLNRCNIKIVFPSFRIDRVQLELHESVIEFQNIENICFNNLIIRNTELKNKDLYINMIGGRESSIDLDRIKGLERLTLKSVNGISENRCKLSNCEDLVYLDAEGMNLRKLTSDTFRCLDKLKKCRIRLDNGILGVVCSRCGSLEELELYGTINDLQTMSLTYGTSNLRKLVLNVEINTKLKNKYSISGDYVLEEIINNSNVPTVDLFDKDFLEICKICRNNEKLKFAYKRLDLKPVWSNNQIIGFNVAYYKGYMNNNDNDPYNNLLKKGILDIPKEVLAISPRVFKSTTSLTKVIFNGPIELGDEAFKDCNKLTSIENSEYIYKMGNEVFAYDYRLEEFRCGDKLEKINKSTFIMCKALKKLYISKSIKELEDYSLFCCTSLELEGYTDFKFTKKAVLDKNYIFSLNNSEIAQLAIDISRTDWITLKEIVRFSEIAMLRNILESFTCKSIIKKEFSRTRDTNLEKLLKLLNSMYEFDRKNFKGVKINTPCDIKQAGNSTQDNYYYMMLAKQANITFKKLQCSGYMSVIENSLKE